MYPLQMTDVALYYSVRSPFNHILTGMKTHLPIPAGWYFLALGRFPPSSQRVEGVLLINPWSSVLKVTDRWNLVVSLDLGTQSAIIWIWCYHLKSVQSPDTAAIDKKEDACNASLFSVDILNTMGEFLLPNAWCSILALPACNDFFLNVMRGIILTSFL